MKMINPKRQWTVAPIPNWLLSRTEITLASKVIYARLCQHCNDHGVAFPRQSVLAQECGVTIRTVERAIGQLCDVGLLVKTQRGLTQSNEYRFSQHEWMDGPPDKMSVQEPDKMSVQDTPKMSGHIKGASKRCFDKAPYSPPRGTDTIPDDFEAFWKAYPRSVGKQAALKAYRKALKRKGVDPDQLRSALTAHKLHWQGTKPEFIPHASTWLNQERYLDELSEPDSIPPGLGVWSIWDWRMTQWVESGYWRDNFWGPKPGERGCYVPGSVLAKFNLGSAQVEAAE